MRTVVTRLVLLSLGLGFYTSLCAQGIEPQAYEDGFKRRGEILVDVVADQYVPPGKTIGDPEKYYWPKAIARLEKYGLNDSAANSWVNEFASHPPFHFTLVGMARIMYRYPNMPAIEQNRIRYLQEVFAREDSYNSWTAEGTENHVSMSRTSGLLYAQLAKTLPPFTEAGQRYDQVAAWHRRWAKRLYEVGNGEWNSSIYEAYNLIGWLNVYDYIQDPSLKSTARAVLDYYATEIALFYSYGAIGGPEMRGNGIGETWNSSAAWLGYLWFGAEEGEVDKPLKPGSEMLPSMHAFTSSYRPPLALVTLARKGFPTRFYRASRPTYLLDKPSFNRIRQTVGSNFTLGSVTNTYAGFSGTTAQMVTWKLVIPQPGQEIPFSEISGNGAYVPVRSGRVRNPFTQVIQDEKVLFQLTQTPKNIKEINKKLPAIFEQWDQDWRRDFIARYPTETHKAKNRRVVNGLKDIQEANASYLAFTQSPRKEKRIGNSWVMDYGQVWVIATSLKSASPESAKAGKRQDLSLRTLVDKAPLGQLCGWVVEVVELGRYKTWDEFTKKVETQVKLARQGDHSVQYISTEGTKYVAEYTPEGTYEDALVDWGFGPKEATDWQSSPPFLQPAWPKENGGRKARLSINGKWQDDESEWPVFSGPDLEMDKSILQIGESYRVVFAGDEPEFGN